LASKRRHSRKQKKLSIIEFQYRKTESFRTYHLDGVIGGLTPGGMIYIEPFVERQPTPRKVQHKIVKQQLGSILESECENGVIRQIECGLIMDLRSAFILKNWLGEQLNRFNK
jgi:hypothetical protein